jgi:hypothetical protein
VTNCVFIIVIGFLMVFGGFGFLFLNLPLLKLLVEDVSSVLRRIPTSYSVFLILFPVVQIVLGILVLRAAMRWLHHGEWTRTALEVGSLLSLVLGVGLVLLGAMYMAASKDILGFPAPFGVAGTEIYTAAAGPFLMHSGH